MIPDLYVMRPADCNETSGAYKVAVERSKLESMPTFMAFTRQALPNLPNSSIENVMKGAYAVVECEDPELILVATGSEVHLCVDAAKEMRQKVRVVSMPCWELFRAQPESYKEALLPKSVPKMSVEAAVTMGWEEWADAFVGINVFGASATGGTCLDRFGFNVPNIVNCAGRCLKGERGALSDGSQAKSKACAQAKSKAHADTPRACSGAAQELPSLLRGRPEIPSKKGSGPDSQEARGAKVASWSGIGA
jgi:hypothetical protein